MSPSNGSPRPSSGRWKPHSPPGASAAFRSLAVVVRPLMNLLMGKEWRGLQTLPDTGFVAVANHVSEIDPLAVGHAIYRSGNTLHFMAKDSLFKVPVLRSALRRTNQIPVSRGERAEVGRSLKVAAEVLAGGGAIVIYPEGTLTRDPELWPMRAKTGAVRLALTTGAPLIPVTHWGVNDFLPPYGKRPKLLPRQKYTLQVGDEVYARPRDLRIGTFAEYIAIDEDDVALKPAFERSRPDFWEHLSAENTFSFPSGHAMGSMSLAAPLVVLAWGTRYRWASLAVAVVYVLAVGASRVYLGVHFPSDVLAGWCLTVLWVGILVVILLLVTRVLRRYAPTLADWV